MLSLQILFHESEVVFRTYSHESVCFMRRLALLCRQIDCLVALAKCALKMLPNH